MKSNYLTIVLAFGLLSSSVIAQLSQGNIPIWRTTEKYKYLPTSSSYRVMNTTYAKSENTFCIKTDFSPEAFFCKMEDRFRNRLHIFVKFRAGNDEMYRTLIAPRPEQH